MPLQRLIIILLLSLGALPLMAQPVYNMGNFTVSDCEGVLLDSEVGNSDNPTGYDHNENYTFTICVPNANSVTINFEVFELEMASSGNVKLDILTIYAGPDRNSPQVGEYTGDQNPGSITINGPCVTIHFVSDASVNAEGWRMTWIFDPPDPIPPVINPIPDASCDDTQVLISFDKGVVCNQINTNNISVNGPAGVLVDASPVNCTNDTTSQVLLTFNPALTQSGTYTVTCDIVYFDDCGRPFQFTVTGSFQIVDCPLIVEIVGDTIICEGDCTDLFADVQGGDFNNYQYTWQATGPNAAINRVCPTQQFTTYIVTVTDGNSTPSSDTVVVEVLPRPTMPANFAVCRFAADTVITADPAGGFWGGPGMNQQGRFRASSAGAGTHTITYFAPNGCPNTMQITVHPINTPFIFPICVGNNNVQVWATPTGGTWSGSPNITPAGMYNAVAAGDDTITYTEPNFGCQKQTIVRVVDSIAIAPRDSIVVCSNEAPFNLDYDPVGGFWQGNGVNNGGRFNPQNAGPGLHKLWYTINGCVDTTTVEVFDIYAGVDTVLCPTNPAFQLSGGSPANGIWSGPGVTAAPDSSFYTFNTPAFLQQDTTVILDYELGGCVDQKIVYLINTRADDLRVEICEYDSIAVMGTANIGVYPPGGTWFGPNFSNDTVDARNLAIGDYYVYYEYNNNGCLDSIALRVKEQPQASTPPVYDTICPKEVDFDLIGTPAGGVWSGLGIVDNTNGTFSPTGVGFSGTFNLRYNFNGCEDTTQVLIRVPVLNISGLAPVYCFEYGRTVQLNGTPSPGYFEGPGIDQANSTFDPGVAGPGIHLIQYIYGQDACEYRDTQYVTVQEPLSIDSIVFNDTICFGEQTTIQPYISGGREDQSTYRLTWTPTDFGGTPFNLIVGPDTTTTYSLTVRDRATNYCSYSVSQDITIVVNPELTWDSDPGPPVCYGDTNFINLYQTSPNALQYDWELKDGSNHTGDYLRAPAGLYDLTVTDRVTGCSVDAREELPQFPFLEAEIILIPEVECISILDPTIYVINSTVGATQGFWTMGDTSGLIPWTEGGNFEYTYADTGFYRVRLEVSNGGGMCVDSAGFDICVEKISKAFIPNAFTPNRDGDNDSWPTGGVNQFGNWVPEGYDVIDFEYIIFDRWGHEVFNSENHDNTPWNGNFKNREGEKCRPGVYSYIAVITFDDFNIQRKLGTVTLLR